MPVFKEEKHLAAAVRGVLEQDYPGEMEVVLAVAPSPDRTEAVATELAAADPRIRLVTNPSGRTPTGLNAALAATRHDIVVRVDGHGELSPGYIQRAIVLLEQTGAANVGGFMDTRGQTALERAVASAMRSPFGMGVTPFRTGGQEGPADSVYLGVFRREVLARLGGFDEDFHRAQDWELNFRIRRNGGLVWFSPDLSVVYRPRSSLPDVAKQFYGTGGWRRHVMRRYPETATLRYLAPPGVVLLLMVGIGAGVVGVFGSAWLRLGWLAPLGYAGLLLAGGAMASRGERGGTRLLTPIAMGTMHISWGLGFLRGVR